MVRHFVDELPEAWRLSFARARHPKRAYFMTLPTQPISQHFGSDRGTPVDRFYIEQFLDQSRPYIHGRCLEVQNADYTQRYGHDLGTVDILDIDPENPKATHCGDLCDPDTVPADTYDCVIMTQVFQYIRDVDAAVRATARILKPGGTALVTLPALHKSEARAPHYWLFTPCSAKYLFTRHFPESHVEVGALGNALTGMAFWIGLAQEDLRRKDFEVHDPSFPCTVTVRATRPV